ncbi:MAG: damage-inducible protein DinB [Rhodospirillaceae bacterium]|mgnify:FL=1|jgi:uncharacterized damage-inducible protein DinB|nr:damage-inducible protein DinB [Rhodospirillaceae bacterium]MBT5037957.1 damage-inducible protein DinB [Rhodospirillaceae bacterium]MBT5778803.1 damage-inducible protein DinB [Rhodospirillaceae bacterium]MBT7293425.1 damage-inducible protein DinB [Rhodospirillaceae bacterium]
MISPDYVRTMATYNRWQNGSLYDAANTLSDDERKQARGAFFGSIHATLNHILWGDQIWMSRFTGAAAPAISEMAESTRIYAQWEDLSAARTAFDETITSWAAEIDQKWLDGDLTWTSVANNRTFSKPMWQLVTHMFNHQTHHRGQVHAMLTAAGARPDDTDIPFMPARSNHD